MRYNSAAADTFAKVVRGDEPNWTVRCWASLSATYWICFTNFEHDLGIYAFKPTWPFLIVVFLETWTKFLKPSSFGTVITNAFTFHTTMFVVASEALWLSSNLQSRNSWMLHVHLSGFQITHEVQQCIKCQHTNYHNNTNHSGYLPQLELLWLVGWVLGHISHCKLFNAKSSLYIYIKYIWFGLVGFYSISAIVGYLMPNPLYTYILNI